MSQEQEQDREFEAYLKGESPLSRTYAGVREQEPPARLDHAILAEAHRAVGGQAAHAQGRSAWRRWSLPLSVAATLIVAVLVGLELPYLPRQGGYSAPAPAAPEAQDKQAARAKQFAGVERDKFAAPDAVPAAAPAALPAPGAQVPAKRKAQAEPPRGVETVNPALKDSMPVQQETKPAATIEGAAAPTADQSAVAHESAGAEQRRATRLAKPEAPAAAPVTRDSMPLKAAPAMEAAPAAEAAPPAATEAAPPPAAEAAPPAAMEAAPAAMLAAPPPPAASTRAYSTGSQPSAPAGSADPRAWLERIRQLKQAGKRDEAKKELASFRRQYPRYSVPGDLRDLQ